MIEDERAALKAQATTTVLMRYALGVRMERQYALCARRQQQYEQARAVLARQHEQWRRMTRDLQLVTERLQAPPPPTEAEREAELDRVEAEILDESRWLPLTPTERHDRATTWLIITERMIGRLEGCLHIVREEERPEDGPFAARVLQRLIQRRAHLRRYLLPSTEKEGV